MYILNCIVTQKHTHYLVRSSELKFRKVASDLEKQNCVTIKPI